MYEMRERASHTFVMWLVPIMLSQQKFRQDSRRKHVCNEETEITADSNKGLFSANRNFILIRAEKALVL